MYELDVVRRKLPNVMQFENGDIVKTKADWLRRRQEIIAKTVELEYGGMPPEPAFTRVEPIHTPGPGRLESYRVITGTNEHPFSFILQIFRPAVSRKAPVLLTGDGCYRCLNDAVIDEALGRGYVVARFNRTEFAPDLYNMDRTAGIFLTYPDTHFSTISAWAWGYSRAVDALLTMDFVDSDEIAITGHSRGGKTVLLAGALDERIKYVNPNDSGAHGCGSYCYEMNVPESEEGRNERLDDLFRNIPNWMGQEMRQYIGTEEQLPHDMHFIKALVAPRYLLENAAKGDVWGNPRGSYQTHIAAKQVFAFLGCEDHTGTWYREGFHDHSFADFAAFFDFMDCIRSGQALPAVYTQDPYPGMDFIG